MTLKLGAQQSHFQKCHLKADSSWLNFGFLKHLSINIAASLFNGYWIHPFRAGLLYAWHVISTNALLTLCYSHRAFPLGDWVGSNYIGFFWEGNDILKVVRCLNGHSHSPGDRLHEWISVYRHHLSCLKEGKFCPCRQSITSSGLWLSSFTHDDCGHIIRRIAMISVFGTYLAFWKVWQVLFIYAMY